MHMLTRRRRLFFVLLVSASLLFGLWWQATQPVPSAEVAPPAEPPSTLGAQDVSPADTPLAIDTLESLAVKGRAPKTDYAREQFGAGWASVDRCDMRQYILARDMVQVQFDPDGCTVLSGTLYDPYTGKVLSFVRGTGTSSAVQIDHVVALSNAWQTGAQQLDVAVRAAFANDPLNLLAVDGPINQQKSDADAASWLPPNKGYRCRYVARQIAVKHTYDLWVTSAEKTAMQRQLSLCPGQRLPLVEAQE